MGFVRFDENGCLLDAAGNPVHIVGINYVASYACTDFWSDWRPEVIEKDLANIAALGLTAVRIPMHWPFMEPEEGKYNVVFEERFRQFVEMCRRYQLYIMPWFLVGVATKEYDVPYRLARSYFCPDMTRIEKNHLKHFIEPYKDEEQILFWDICDEPEYYSRQKGAEQLPYDQAGFADWTKALYDAIRSVDQNHLITMGIGFIASENFGMDIREISEILDLMVVTCYPQILHEGLDTARNNYTIPFHVKMNKRSKPVFTCEAPGMSAVWYSEKILGRYFKTSIYSNLINGSAGVLPWVYNDYEESLWDDMPLKLWAIEQKFGIMTTDGRLRPSGAELRDFAAFVKKADIGRYRPQKAEVAVLVPDGYYKGMPNAFHKIYTAYVLAKGCSVDVDFVWTSENLSDYKLILMPALCQMTNAGWKKLMEYVKNGGMIYHPYERSELSGYFNEFFGIEVQTRDRDYGYQGMTAQKDWGCWKQGDILPFTGTDRKYMIRVEAEGAEVLFRFEDGEPAFLRHEYGDGVCYLATAEVDNGLMRIPYRDYLGTKSFGILDTMIEEAKVKRRVCFAQPVIEVGCMEHVETGEMLVICINHDKSEVSTEMRIDRTMIPDGWEMYGFETGELVDWDCRKVCFEPAGVLVYRIAPKEVN